MLHPALSAAGIRNAVFDREKQPKLLYFKQVQEHLLINLYDTVKKGFVQVKLHDSRLCEVSLTKYLGTFE